MGLLGDTASRKWLLPPLPSAKRLGGDLLPSADPSTVWNCPSFSHPCPGERVQLHVFPASAESILQRHCLTRQTCLCHHTRTYNMPPAGKRAIAPDGPATTFLNLPLATKAFPRISRLPLFLGKILGLSFFSSEVVSGKTEATQVEKTATPASGCPRPRAMAGEHCASAPPPLSQCFSAPPSKVSN